jgi:hypothetical protein
MAGCEMKRMVATGFVVLLVLVGQPAALSALSADEPETDSSLKRDGTVPATAPIWDSSPATVVVAPPAAAPAAPQHALSANPLWELPLTALSQTRDRPVFSASRRPPPPPAATAAVVKVAPPPKPREPERPSLSLVGTVAGDNESIAIFVEPATKAAMRLRVGEDYQGWKLNDVHGREVTLAKDEQTFVLSLPQPGFAAGGSAPQPMTQISATLSQPPARRK